MVPFLISNVLLNKSSTCVNQQMLSNKIDHFLYSIHNKTCIASLVFRSSCHFSYAGGQEQNYISSLRATFLSRKFCKKIFIVLSTNMAANSRG